MLTEKHEKILEARQIGSEIVAALGWRSSDEWLEIPVIKDGEEVGYKRRTIEGEKKFTQKKGTPQIFYNFDALKDAKEIVITEGEMDCAVALQCGYLAVSVPNGAPMEQIEEGGSKYAYLDDLPKDCVVTLAVDNDGAGRNLLHDLSVRIGTGRCKWVGYPKGCKDLNDTIVKYGRAGVKAVFDRAQWMEVKGLRDMFDFPPPPDLEIHPCPIDGMSEHYKIRLGDLTVITGIPSYGKTTFTNELMAGMAQEYDWNVLVGSFEQSPRVDHLRNLRTLYAGRQSHLLSASELEAADKWISKHFKFIAPDLDTEAQLDWVLNCIEAGILRYQSKLVIVDPWNELDHDRPAGITLTEYTGFAIKQFKKMAQRLRVHIVIVAHPAKMTRGKDGIYPMPSLYDISDSAHWYNKPDIGIIVHRDEENAIIRIAKCRYSGIIGKQGEVKLEYDDYSNTFRAVTI